jgi:hypothetical protein
MKSDLQLEDVIAAEREKIIQSIVTGNSSHFYSSEPQSEVNVI